jgi:arabinogalactan endo-1,4-beta-galactosidase
MQRCCGTVWIVVVFTVATLDAQRNRQFILGADISWVDADIDRGTRYYDGTVQKDIFDILADYKFNCIRLRTFVDPTANPGSPEAPYSTAGYCDLKHTIEFAKNIKGHDMLFLLDFHYSDLWCDPGKQFKPVSWAGLTFDQLTEQVRTYTRESLEACKAAGVLPDMVQVGNEIVGGMIWPDGRSSDMEKFAALVNAGIDGVKDVSDDIQIFIHSIAEKSPSAWLGSLIKAGVDRIDIFGLSYYSEWHGTPNDLKGRLIEITQNHDVQIAVAEYADNHEEVNNIVFNLPGDKGLGTFVWEPTRWRETLFTNNRTNARIDIYPKLSQEYRNDTLPLLPPPVAVYRAGPNRKNPIKNAIRCDAAGIFRYEGLVPAGTQVDFFTLQGRLAASGICNGAGKIIVGSSARFTRMGRYVTKNGSPGNGVTASVSGK